MKTTLLPIRPSLAVATALLLAASAGAAGASRSACTPKPASDDVRSQVADALSAHVDAAQPIALANWDVGWWQRRRVWITLAASNEGDAATQLLPQMVVDARPDGSAARAQFGLPLALPAHGRATQRLALYIPDDSRTLGVRTLVATPAQPVTVSFSLECSDSRYDPGEFAPAVAPLLDEAVKTYFNGAVDPLSDPNAALQAVRQLSGGAQDATDVAWTMRGLMQALHDDHGFYALPGEALPARRVLATRAPDLELRADGTAVLRLHAVDTASAPAALAWATSLHDGIAAVAARHPRGWIIDLRDHDGDSPWPSLAALSTLLDGPAVGSFNSRQGKQEWIVERGAVRIAGGQALVDTQPPPEPDYRGPVALLLGPGTRDAGEDVAVAFRGRPNTRSFGKPTAGFPLQGVQVHRLSDGSTLGVLETRAADRTGVVHRVPLEPETLLREDATAAVPQPVLDWLYEGASR
ncbi:MAG: S41 family peptidase [Vitreoscilla sp.]